VTNPIQIIIVITVIIIIIIMIIIIIISLKLHFCYYVTYFPQSVVYRPVLHPL
jgi:hypothetical protein